MREGILAMKAEVGVMHAEDERDPKPRMWAASRSWKGKGRQSPLEPPEGMQVCQHPDFSVQNLFQTSDLQNGKMIHLCCFKPLHLW